MASRFRRAREQSNTSWSVRLIRAGPTCWCSDAPGPSGQTPDQSPSAQTADLAASARDAPSRAGNRRATSPAGSPREGSPTNPQLAGQRSGNRRRAGSSRVGAVALLSRWPVCRAGGHARAGDEFAVRSGSCIRDGSSERCAWPTSAGFVCGTRSTVTASPWCCCIPAGQGSMLVPGSESPDLGRAVQGLHPRATRPWPHAGCGRADHVRTDGI